MSQGRAVHRDALSLVERLRPALRALWRRARGRCRTCDVPLRLSRFGARWPGPGARCAPSRDCYHCLKNPRLCHSCGKSANFWSFYDGPPAHPNCRCVVLGVDYGREPSRTFTTRVRMVDGNPHYEHEEIR